MTEAGIAHGLKVNLLARRTALFEPVGVSLKDQGARIGIDVNLDAREYAAFSESRHKRAFQALVQGGPANTTDPVDVGP